MSTEVVVPQIGEAIATLKLTRWLKATGDAVRKGDVLFEVDSDKAIVEVEAFVEGTLTEILSPAGSDVLPQQVVARIGTAQEIAAPKAFDNASSVPALSDARSDEPKVTPVAQRLAQALGVDLGRVPGSGPRGRIVSEDVRNDEAHRSNGQRQDGTPLRINASPKAKRLARQAGLDLSLIEGSGADGMIQTRDLVKITQDSTPTHATPMPIQKHSAEPLSKRRQTVALRTLESKQTVPHFYLLTDVNMTESNRLRDYCRSAAGWDRPPTYTDLVLRACALGMVDVPSVNRSYRDDGLVAHQHINLGVAVDTDAGLVVPVLADVDSHDLRQLSVALRAAVERARKGSLSATDLSEKSMVISNLGMYSIDAFIAIIDVPDPMILAVGRVTDRVVPVSGQPAIQPMCTLTLSADHRVLDGAQAARFLERVKQHLENPYALMGR